MAQTVETIPEAAKEHQNMILDAVTLKNLDILPDPTNPNLSTLFQYVNHTVTPVGKRLLLSWLSQPLLDIDEINESDSLWTLTTRRLDAVTELMEKPELTEQITHSFTGLADIDRLLSRLHDYCSSVINKAHPDNRAQYYEDKKYNSRKIRDFVTLMDETRKILDFGKSLSVSPASSLLRRILLVRNPKDLGKEELGFPDMTETLTFFDQSFNHDLAIDQGIIMPQRGIDPELDSVTEELTGVQRMLDNYLEEMRSKYNAP